MIPYVLALALAAPAGDDVFAPASADGTAVSITVEMISPPGMPFTVGVRARGTAVRVRNGDPQQAVALRSIGWRHGVPNVNWLVPVLGRAVEERDGTIALDPLATSLTALRFEHGLLLPGEELVVPLELPVGPGPTQRLEVAYAIVGNDIRGWRTEILLPRVDEMSHAVFGPVTTDALELRRLEGGGRALARSTMKEGYLPLGEGTATFEVAVDAADAPERTGGLTAEDVAATLSGAADVNAAWESTLRAWLVVAADGRAAMIGKRGIVEFGGGWSLAAPALVNADGEGNTRAFLHPDVFGDVVRVARPSFDGAFYVPGATVLGPGDLRKVLERAHERDLGVRVVAVDPNGFGTEHLLSVGVDVDPRGRWIDPAIEPEGS